MENEREEWEALVRDAARRAAEECTLTDGYRIVAVMRSHESVGYECTWAAVVSDPETRMSGLAADEGILLDWDELDDDELDAMEAMCPDAYSVALHFLKGDMGLEDSRWARPATDPAQGVCLLSCNAMYLGDYVNMSPVEAGRAWLENNSEVEGVRERDASEFLKGLPLLCEDDEFARFPAEECGAFLDLGRYGHNCRLAYENSTATKDKGLEEIGITPTFRMRDAELLASWYHLDEAQAARLINEGMNRSRSQFTCGVWDYADTQARAVSEFAREHPGMPSFDFLEADSGNFPDATYDALPGYVTPSELEDGDYKSLDEFLDSWASENPTLAATFVAAMEEDASRDESREAGDRDGEEI